MSLISQVLSCLPILALVSCSETVAVLDNAPCPCVESNVCCPGAQRCAPSLDACPQAAQLMRVVPAQGGVGGGYPVELFGSGLDLPLEVSLGGRPCPVVEREQDRLRCTSPPGPPSGGPVDITLELDGRIEASRGDAFVYAEPNFEEIGEALGLLGDGLGPGVSLADIDLDGQPDVAFPVLSFFLDVPFELAAQVFLRSGGFYEQLPLPIVWRHGAVLPIDLSNDGVPELLFSSEPPPFLELLARTSTSVPYEEAGELRGGTRVDYAPIPIDLDGDGDLDLVGCYNVASEPELWVRVMVNDNGNLVFDDDRVGLPRLPNLHCGVTSAGDLDHDGRPELLFCGDALFIAGITDDGRVLINERFFTGFGLGGSCSTAAVRDFDLDGDMDLAIGFDGNVNVFDAEVPSTGLVLLTSPEQQTGVSFLEAQGPLELPSSPSEVCDRGEVLPNATLPLGIGASLWLDIDLDGDEDVLLPTPAVRCGLAAGAYLSLAAQGEFAYSYQSYGDAPILGSAPGGAIGDLDGDGDLDAVVANGLVGRRAVFSSRARQSAGQTHHFVKLAPVTDGDGDATDEETGDDRPAWTVVVQMDLDDGNFEPGPNLRTRVVGDGRSNRSHGYPEVLFGLGARTEPVWVRVYFADGSVLTRQVEVDGRWVLRDCGESTCS